MKPPAFQFYAAEYLADEHVQLMSLEEEGAYIRLLAFCWREGSIPSDLSALSRLCKGASTTVLAEVVKRFKPNTNDARLVHPRLETERLKQSQWREKSAQGGRASAHKRKQRKNVTAEQGGATKPQAERLKQKPTLQSSSSVSSSTSSSEGGREPALEIFDFWKTEMALSDAQFTADREAAIRERLEDSMVEEIKAAIRGCKVSDFHMGRESGKPQKLNGIEFICQKRSRLEMFIAMAPSAEHETKRGESHADRTARTSCTECCGTGSRIVPGLGPQPCDHLGDPQTTAIAETVTTHSM